ncbi:hypothetical protein BDR03DRAFT_1014102 [Suillus americanus]|nr:hypothetical protein BDR03DRAFT_1014102 [Suillus americanus]
MSRPSANPTGATRTNSAKIQQPYPLCTSNYCLLHLRSTCSLWAFVRTCVIEWIWEEEPVIPNKKPAISVANGTENTQESSKRTFLRWLWDIFRAVSPPPRPRSRVASPAPLPSRVSSPIPHRASTPIALSRSRAGSPAPPRTGSPPRRAVPVPPAASQAEAKKGIPMPSAELSKYKVPLPVNRKL